MKLAEASMAEACLAVFNEHRVEAFSGAFHVPAAREYGCLFSWDSGYHALAVRHLDHAAAFSELRTLYGANTTEQGLLSHERPLPGSEARTRLVEQWLGPIYRADQRSWLIDPPVAAYAVARLFDPARDTDTKLLHVASAHLQAIDRLRLVSPGGSPVILHPLESGTDASPLFDSLVDASSQLALLASHRDLSVHLAGIEYSAGLAGPSGHGFIVSDPVFCGWHLLALEELSSAWRRAGDQAQAERLEVRATELAEAMVREMWSEDLAMFVGYDHVAHRQMPVETLGGVIGAASRHMIDRGLSARVVAAHLQPSTSRFWGPAGISFNPLDGQEIKTGAMLWRGDVVWGATQYWAHLVLMRNDRPELAREVRLQTERLIAKAGFREFYSAVAGVGYGAGEAASFTWPALVLEMAAQERASRPA